MTLMDPDGMTPEPEVVQETAEDYSDFGNPTNLLRAPSWLSASPAARPKLIDRAMNAHIKALEADKGRTVDTTDAAGEAIKAPVWNPDGTLTGKGMESIEKTRQLLQTAAQDPEGGIYMNTFNGKWETSPWVDDFNKGPKPKAFDPLHDMSAWKTEKNAIATEDSKPAETFEDFVAFANAETKADEAKLDVNSKELKDEWTRRMKINDFDPRSMGDKVFEEVGGQMAINPDTAMNTDKAEGEIEAMDIPESQKRLLRLQHQKFVESNAATFVNMFAAADAGVLGAIYSRPLNDEFNEAMSKPGASAYEFIKANKERFNKDNYGVTKEVFETFRDAVMATGTGALWLGSFGNYTSPAEAWGGLAADSGKAYNNTTQFSIGGIDINRRDLTELTGQIGSFIAMGGAGALAGKGLLKAGVDKGSRYGATAVKARAAAQVTDDTALAATKTFGEKAVAIGKALTTDPEMILGSLQASGMSYGRTFNDTFERTGSREEAHKAATITGVADGLGALIATGVMNRFSVGAGKLLGMSDNGGLGAVQNIRSRVSSSKTMKEVVKSLDDLKSMTPELRKATAAGLATSMNEASKKLGLRGWGVAGDVIAEGIEESMDEIISGAIQSMSHDSKSWTEAEWEQIQDNWQGYVKAGILGAIGGTAGAVQGAVVSPKQVFGKSAALEQQEGLWKKIKTRVEKFDSVGMTAISGRKDGIKDVAEYLADPNTSIEDKAQVLTATARGINLVELLSKAPEVPSTASEPASATNPQPEASEPLEAAPTAQETPSNEETTNTKVEAASQAENPAANVGETTSGSEGQAAPVVRGSELGVGDAKPSNDGKQPDANEADFVSTEPTLASAKTDEAFQEGEKVEWNGPIGEKRKASFNGPSSFDPQLVSVTFDGESKRMAVKPETLSKVVTNESETPKPLISPEQNKANIPSTDTLTKEEKPSLTGLRSASTRKVDVGARPVVNQGSKTPSHQGEVDEAGEPTGLWVARDGKVTLEPKLFRELVAKHDDDSDLIAEEIEKRAKDVVSSPQKPSTPLQRFRESLPQALNPASPPVAPKVEPKAEEPTSEKEAEEIAAIEKESETLETLPDEAPVEDIRKAAPTLVDTAVVEAMKFDSKDKFFAWLRGFSKELSRFGEKIWSSAKMMAIAIAGISIAPNSTNQEIASVAEISPMVASLEVSYESPILQSKDEFQDAEFDSNSNELPLLEENNVASLDVSTLPLPSIVNIDVPAPLVEVETKPADDKPSLESTEDLITSNEVAGSGVILTGKLSKWWLEQGSDPSVNAGAALLNERESSSSRIKSMLVSLGVSQSPSTFPWCTAFTSWSLRQGGFAVKNFSARAFLNMGQKTTSPSYGDVTVLWNENPNTGGRNGWGGHTGFYLGETSTHVILLSGNSDDSVNVAAFPKTRVLGHRSFGINGQLVQNRSVGKRRLPRRKKKNESSIAKLDALPTKLDALPPGAAATVVPDADSALIVASDTIENGQTDSSGGTWERVDNRTPQEKEAAARNVVQDGMGEKVTYEYAPPKGQVLSVKVGEVVLIQGEPDSVLYLDSILNGRWRFRKVSLAADGLRLTTMEGRQKNAQFNRTRLLKQAEMIKPHLATIAQGAISIPDLRKLLESIIDSVAPGFKSNFVEGKLEGRSYIQTHPDTGVVTVDMQALKRELHSLYQAVNTSNGVTNGVLAADVARVMAKWVDEEVIHIIAGKEFTVPEMKWLYKAIASNPEHPFYELLKDTVAERFPGAEVDPKSKLPNSIARTEGGAYLVAMELIRKLHQLKNSGSYSERAVYESLLLQGAVNKDTKNGEWGGPVKLINTVAALVKRYSDRIRNILWMRYQTDRLPVDQQQMLFRLDAAYKLAGVQGDTEFAQSDVLQNRIELQRDFSEDLRTWGDKVTGQHFQAVAQLRKLTENFRTLKFGNLFDVDPETLAMTIHPVIRQYLSDHKIVEDWQPIDALLDDLNDISPTTGEIGRTGLERAKTLLFINYEVMQARMAAMDFDLTPVLDLSSPDAGKTLQRIGEHIANTVPVEQQENHYRELETMWNRRAVLIEQQIDFVREAITAQTSAAIEALDATTMAGRRRILAEAKRVEIENPFAREGVNPERVTAIMERLKGRVIERIKLLSQHSSAFIETGNMVEALVSPSAEVMMPMVKTPVKETRTVDLKTLEAEHLAARRSATDAEAKYLTAQDAASSLPSEASSRMTSFLEFTIALKAYNDSVAKVHELAFGDIWNPPQKFGLNFRNLDSRTGNGMDLKFDEGTTKLTPTDNPDEVFGVKFKREGDYLGFRPKKHWGKNLSKQEEIENDERAVLEIAANSNAADMGRMLWNQFQMDLWMGRLVGEDHETYRQTGGFDLEKEIGENDSVKYHPEKAFQSTDVRLFLGLLMKAQDEAHRFSKKSNTEKTVHRDALIKHVEEMREWAKRTLAQVEGENTILTMGGNQTEAGRAKSVIVSQFAHKDYAPLINGKPEVQGLVTLLADLSIRLARGTHAELDGALGMNSDLIAPLRARMDGANDASRLTNKSLISFMDDQWQKNFETEGSTTQRMLSFVPDNEEMLELRDSVDENGNLVLGAPADIRMISGLSFFMAFHSKASDYQMGSNFGFEMRDDFMSANRGSGDTPQLYKEGSMRKVYLGAKDQMAEIESGTHPSVPSYSRLEWDMNAVDKDHPNGTPFYWKQRVADNAQGNLTDRNGPGDDFRTGRANTFDDTTGMRAGDSQMTWSDFAINQEDSPEVQRRYVKTKWAMMIGAQTNGEFFDAKAGETFLWDLHSMERGGKSQLETRELIRKGLRGMFPLGRTLENSEAFYDALYDAMDAERLFPQARFVPNEIKGVTISPTWNPPSMETILTKYYELKVGYEAAIVEQAMAGHAIGRALATVKRAAGRVEQIVDKGGMFTGPNPLKNNDGGVEIDQEVEEDVETEVPNPNYDPAESDNPFTLSKPQPRTINKTEKVKKIKKVRKEAILTNSLASPEEADSIARMMQGEMLRNGRSSKDSITRAISNSGALAVADASLMVHGIDGVGNALLSQLIQTYPGETLVVSPTDDQVTQYGLQDVGFKIIPGVEGASNVVYVPSSQKNPDRNQSESWGGYAQSLMIAAKSNMIAFSLVRDMARQIRFVMDPAVFPESVPEGDEMAGHLADLAHLGELLKVRGDGGASISMFGDDQSLGSDVMVIAEVLANREARSLFNTAYVGTDDIQNTRLSEEVENQLHEGLRSFPEDENAPREFPEDDTENATEDSVNEETDSYDWENTRSDSPWMEALTKAGTIEEQNAILAAEQAKEDKKANKFGPDARRINKRLAKETQNNGLDPATAFLFNSLARIMELGKAGQPRYYSGPEAESSVRDILNQPPDPLGRGASTDKELNARVGPALKGEAGIKKAGAIYVGEMRNLTQPKVGGRTMHNIAFGHKNITSTNASQLLRSEVVRKAVGDIVTGEAIERLGRRPDSTALGRVDVSLPLDDAMMDSIRGVLPEGVLDQHLTEAHETITNLEDDQARFTLRREQLLASLAAADVDNGQAFQSLLDESTLLATAKEWSESLKEQTRELIAAHVTRFAPDLAKASYKAYDMGHELYVTLAQGMNNNPQVSAAVSGLYSNINRISGLKAEYDAQLRLAEDNLPMEKDTNKLLDELGDAMRLFNLHASIFNSHAEMHARQAIKLAHLKGNPNLRLFGVKSFKNTDGVPSKRQLADMQESLADMVNDEKFAEGFMQSMVKEITKGLANGPATKQQTNRFMQDIAKTYLETGADLRSLIDEKVNEALNDDTVSENDEENTIGEDFRTALQEIAMGTAEARYILSSKMETPAMAEARRNAENQLRVIERNLEETTKALEQIDNTANTTAVGLGYYSDTLRSQEGKPFTMGARLALTIPSLPVEATTTPLQPASGTMTPRDYWTRSTAVTRALTEQSQESISDAYKFVRGSGEQFRSFNPLKAINQAVDLVNVEAQIIKEVMQDAQAEAREANYKGLTADAMAYLADPDTMMVFSKSARGKVKQISLPKNHQLRSEKLGVLINQDGDKTVMIAANARELLMRHWPQTVNKRNVNQELSNMVLDALPVTRPGTPASYSYFLSGTEAEVGKNFDGADFSPAKQNLKKGEAAKAFADDWKAGIQTWLNDAMNMTVSGRGKKAKLDGDLAKAQLKQFGYMIERLVISHKDPRLSEGAQKKVSALLDSIDKGEFSQIGGDSKKMDVSRMLSFRVEPVFSQVFAEIETEAIQKALITNFVSFDGKKHAFELGVLKYLHHQDARIRAKFRRDYAARQAAIHLQDFIEYGLDGKSGRQGYETAKKAEEEKIVAAAKPIGNNAKNQTIGYLLSVIKGVDSAFGMHKENAATLLINDLQNGLNELENLNKAQADHFGTSKTGVKNILPTLNRYWNADNLDIMRDLELAREVRGWLNESGITNIFLNTEQVATEQLNKLAALLRTKVDDDKLVEVEAYAKQLNDSFADISSAMQLTMAMLSREAAVDPSLRQLRDGERAITGEAWQDEERQAFKNTYSTVPLRIGFAAHPDPDERQVSSDRFITDPIDLVSLKDSSFFGGFGKGGYHKKGDPFRPISVNGLTAPLSLLDDAIYKLNVTPTYEVLRRSFGRVMQDEHGVNTIKDGDFLNKANSMIPDDIDWNDPDQRALKTESEANVKRFRQALSAIAEENETVLQNDAANGVLNTGGAETMRFLGSVYIVRALASVQQVWNQTSGPSVGYAVGKIAVGKGRQAAQYFSILQQLITNRAFNDQAREYVRRIDRSVYYRSADGADIARDIMHSQIRFGKSRAKNLAGKWLREYEKLGEKALEWTIGKGEAYLSTAMFIVELADQMQVEPAEMVRTGVEPTAMAKSNARRKVNDVMAQSDQSKKSWMFQNRTSSPSRNALWRSMVRFSNHTSSVASNTSVMIPILFDSKADAETKREALENVVTSLTQNILFTPFKLQMLIPIVAYLLYGIGGDDDDKAQKKAQKLANEWMAVDDDSSMLGEVIKTISFGKKKEFFDQTKKADAAQASAFAEILTKGLVETATTVPILGVLAGYSPISGLFQKSVTNPMAIAGMTGLNNTFNKKKLRAGFAGYDKNGVTIRAFSDSWHGTLADLSAPTAMVHDAMESTAMTAQYGMTREAERNRVASLIDMAVYGAYELIPFAREPRTAKRAELREVIKKEEKRNR